MEFNNVCRLCLTKNNLGWIFNERNENFKMKDVIYNVTGVGVDIKDIISQKICERCYDLTIKIFKFRSQCLKNDTYLKEACRKYFEDELIFMPNNQITTENYTNKNQQKQNKVSHTIHPSITEIFKIYPEIKLPPKCLKSHIAPVVCVETDQIEKYLKNRKLDVDGYIQCSLKSIGISESAKPNSFIHSVENNFENKYLLNKNENNKIIGKDTENFKINDNRTDNGTLNESDAAKNSNVHNQNRVKKRRLSESENAPVEKKCKRVVSKESLDQKSVTNCPVGTSDFEAIPYVKLAPLPSCRICNTVQNNIDDLRKHEKSHAHCQFCKTRFRTLQLKNLHIVNFCIVKKTMNNLPTIVLEKIEHNIKVRHKYPEAFDGFPLCETSSKTNLSKRYDIEAVKTMRTKIIKRFKTILSGAVDTDLEKEIEGNNFPSEQLDVDILSDAESSTTIPISNKIISTSLNNGNVDVSFSLIEPEIKIRNNRLLDDVDIKQPDLKIMKDLLGKIKTLDSIRHKDIQTDSPTDRNITRLDSIAKLNDLKLQLHAYKIPVTIKFGTFSVSFGQNVNEVRSRKLCLWNNLIPTDIKPVSNQSNNSRILLNKSNGKRFISLSRSDIIRWTSDRCQSNTLKISPTGTHITQSEQTQDTIRTTSESQIKSSDLNCSPLENNISDTHSHVSVIGRIRVKNIEELTRK